MNNKRDKGQPPRNPWVRKTDAEEDEESTTPEPDLPPSPWSLEVPARPPSPWDTPDAGTAGSAPSTWDAAGTTPPATGGTGVQGASETDAPWGDKVGPPSLRRPEPVKKGFKLPPVAIPIAAGLAVVVLVAVALVLLTGGDDKGADPAPVPTITPSPSYTPPANALPVQFGVSIVPAPGWNVVAKETNGKQVAIYGPDGAPRAFLWVRQKQNVTANAFVVGIVEGETKDKIAKLDNVRNLQCPKDVLVECVALSYTITPTPGASIKGDVEVYRRKDGVVTALDYQAGADFVATADPAVKAMKQSVLDSL